MLMFFQRFRRNLGIYELGTVLTTITKPFLHPLNLNVIMRRGVGTV